MNPSTVVVCIVCENMRNFSSDLHRKGTKSGGVEHFRFLFSSTSRKMLKWASKWPSE